MARTAEEIAQNIAERQQRAAERAAQAQQRAEERAQRNEERAAKARDKNAERDLDRALKTLGALAPAADMIGRGVGAITGFGGTVESADGVRGAAGHEAQTREELARQRREAVMGAGHPPRANSGFPAQGGDEFRPQTNIGRGQAPQGPFAAPERQLRVQGDEQNVAQAPAKNERGSQLVMGDPLYTQALELVASANVYQANGNTQKRDEMIQQARAVVAQIPKDAFGTLAEPPEADGRRVSTSVVKVNGQEVRYHISERDNATPEGLLEKMANKAATQQGVPSIAPALKASAPKKVGQVEPETTSVTVGMVTPEGAGQPAPATGPQKVSYTVPAAASSAVTQPAPAARVDSQPIPPVVNKAPVSDLKRGGTENVAAVQKNLEILGFATDAGGASDGKVDGIAGKRTQEAVRKVEEILIKAGKLEGKADGVIDDKFAAALEAAKKDPKLVAQLEEVSGKKTAAAAPAQTAQVGVSGEAAKDAAALLGIMLGRGKQDTAAPTIPTGAAGLGIRADREEVIGAVVTKSAEQIRADEKAVADALKQQTQATPPAPAAKEAYGRVNDPEGNAVMWRSMKNLTPEQITVAENLVGLMSNKMVAPAAKIEAAEQAEKAGIDLKQLEVKAVGAKKETVIADEIAKMKATRSTTRAAEVPAAAQFSALLSFDAQSTTAVQPSMDAALAQAREAVAGQRLQVTEAGNVPAAPSAVGAKPMQEQGLTA